jgi:pimeloyl-ACP methyl ester carboxylesterase
MGYQLSTYAIDMMVLLAELQSQAAIGALDWVGTSMGGLIGMVVCGQPALRVAAQTAAGSAAGGAATGAASVQVKPALPVPVRRLVLNDVGPALQWRAIERISAYLGESGHFSSVQAAADAMWAISKGFGPHTPEQWLTLSRPMVRPVSSAADSPWRLHYDPAIALPFKAATEASTQQGEATLWQLYDHIEAQTLLLRGALSDLLSVETAQAMTERGPHARLVEFEGVGHVPTLIAQDQLDVVVGFLLA